MTSRIDITPNAAVLQEYYNLLLAEMETLVLTPETNQDGGGLDHQEEKAARSMSATTGVPHKVADTVDHVDLTIRRCQIRGSDVGIVPVPNIVRQNVQPKEGCCTSPGEWMVKMAVAKMDLAKERRVAMVSHHHTKRVKVEDKLVEINIKDSHQMEVLEQMDEVERFDMMGKRCRMTRRRVGTKTRARGQRRGERILSLVNKELSLHLKDLQEKQGLHRL